MKTALLAQFAARHAQMGEYCGVETALRFSSSGNEFSALVRGCAVYDLGWRGKIRISGNDRVRWLNGMVTNNIRELPQDRGAYNFVLNAQGRILGDLYAYNLGEYFLADVEAPQLSSLVTLLERYIIMDQVELADASSEFTAIGVQGPYARAILSTVGLTDLPSDLLELKPGKISGIDLLSTRMTSAPVETYELWMDHSAAPAIWAGLLAAGALPAGADAIEMYRVASGIPRYGVDIRDRDLPQETGQVHALNSAKGCYVGQEIVERIRSRGAVHRTFAGFTVSGAEPSPGAKLQNGGKDVGEITSVCAVPMPGSGADAMQLLALGYIRREVSQPGTVVSAGDARLTVSRTPFPQIFSVS